jgi:hypothetical protein
LSFPSLCSCITFSTLLLPLDVDFFAAIQTLSRGRAESFRAILLPCDSDRADSRNSFPAACSGVIVEDEGIEALHLTIPASDICIHLFCAVLTGILIG